MAQLKPISWKTVLSAIAVSTLVLAGCGKTTSTEGQKAMIDTSGDTVKVGVLHSLSGTMSISEVSLRDAELMAIDEINASGGVLGKKLSL